ncbi:hypothetical protein QR680_002151 [Steinernema hermaphroditum]|uniref:receptor protein-tyrosine kinase n=1 Tax=Steinernema hermaphroditum TaxID=289476 RepID=A0AA39H4A5_9BILA|nr:hypothetical protein QR680_002151 [Steinernema hermaphroditum]
MKMTSCRAILLSLLLSISVSQASISFLTGAPRFQQKTHSQRFVLLGDSETLPCKAVSKPEPKIHWYRNGKFLGYQDINTNGRLRENQRQMSLEIRQLEIGDQGDWACKVWNSQGQSVRNFTVQILDFCDYYMKPGFKTNDVPERCLCVWFLGKEPRRSDIDWSKVNSERCSKYQADPLLKRPPFLKPPCFEEPCQQTDFLPPSSPMEIVTSPDSPHLRLHDSLPSHANDVESDSADVETKKKRTRTVLAEQPPLLGDDPNAGRRSDSSEIPSSMSQKKEEVDEVTTTTARSPTTRFAPKVQRLSPPIREGVAPYFKVRKEDTKSMYAWPSGRTVQMKCIVGGVPAPQILWYKNEKVLVANTTRATGAYYKIGDGILELEDAAESDSGNYTCEAFNRKGTVRRHFRVDVFDRMRSKPIILEHVLMNRTVDVNSTVNFTCKVISDLTPHFMWVRLEEHNNSLIYVNETNGQHMFNFTDMSKVNKAVIHMSDTSTTLELINVTAEDQGVYACIAGNSLGYSMQPATLTVTEFHTMVIATGDPDDEKSPWTVIILVLLLSVMLAITFICVFRIIYMKLHRNSQINIEKGILRPYQKKVIITKKSVKDNEFGTAIADAYDITIKPMVQRGRRTPIASDLALLTDYHITNADPAYEIDRSRLQLKNIIGEGAFGEVWKGLLRPNYPSGQDIPVAVKKLKANAQEKELRDLCSEMVTFCRIGEHKNIIKLIGCCTGSGPLYVVLELCVHGNLRDFLRAHRPRETEIDNSVEDNYLQPRRLKSGEGQQEDKRVIKCMTTRHLVDFAFQVAQGMEYLSSKKILHRDLAARNVLVTKDCVLKISDFGLSRDVHYHDYYRKKGNGRLPIKWMALEALDSHVYTVHSDVWSYGILLWEIMTMGGTPYPSTAMPELYSCLKKGYRMENPHNCPEEVYAVMVGCWQENPITRPSFATIVDYFDYLLAASEPKVAEVENIQELAPPPPLPERDTEQILQGSLKPPRKVRPLSEPVKLPCQPINNDTADEESEEDEEEDDSDEEDSETSALLSMGPQYAPVYKPPSPNNGHPVKCFTISDDHGANNYAIIRPTSFSLEKSDPPNVYQNLIANDPIGVTPARTANIIANSRRHSCGSQTSSGRGGSSAMSSAERIGGLNDICIIESRPLPSSSNTSHQNPPPGVSVSSGQQFKRLSGDCFGPKTTFVCWFSSLLIFKMIFASLISLFLLCLQGLVCGFPQASQADLAPQPYGDYYNAQEVGDYADNVVEKRAMMRLGKRAMMRLGKRSDVYKYQKRAPFRLG